MNLVRMGITVMVKDVCLTAQARYQVGIAQEGLSLLLQYASRDVEMGSLCPTTVSHVTMALMMTLAAILRVMDLLLDTPAQSLEMVLQIAAQSAEMGFELRMKFAMIRLNLMTEVVPQIALGLSQAIPVQEDPTHQKTFVFQSVGMDLSCQKKTVTINQMTG